MYCIFHLDFFSRLSNCLLFIFAYDEEAASTVTVVPSLIELNLKNSAKAFHNIIHSTTSTWAFAEFLFNYQVCYVVGTCGVFFFFYFYNQKLLCPEKLDSTFRFLIAALLVRVQLLFWLVFLFIGSKLALLMKYLKQITYRYPLQNINTH